ncbi:MAG: NAD+ synthase, partial [Bdellovibrionales bacterium]|nr:NAD+ synthase [Bdellovibrionales bacterium]
MRIALAQINAHLGNFEENYRKIIEYTNRAKERRCDIVVFPEATLFGYHPMDLLKRDSIVKAEVQYIKKISKAIPKGIVVLFGAFTQNPSSRGKPYFNSAIALEKNKKPWICHKELLPTYDVFDDARHIEPGDMSKNIFRYKGKKILITICEDIWAWPMTGQKKKSYYDINPIKKIKPGSVDLILNLSASPFFTKKMERRLKVTRATASFIQAPMVYVNMVGGQDELLFDGGSFAINQKGKVLCQCLQFHEDLGIVDFSKELGTRHELSKSIEENMRQAVVMGIRDFVHKTGQKRVHL